MAMRSLEPVELSGCACDGYGQVDRLIEDRARRVTAIAIDDEAYRELMGDPGHHTAHTIERARAAGLRVLPMQALIDDAHALENDWMLVAGRMKAHAALIDRAWLGIALPSADQAVLDVAMAQIPGENAIGGLNDLIQELLLLQGESPR